MHSERENNFLNEEEILKVVIAFISAGSNFSDEEKLKKEDKKTKLYIVSLIRIIILYYSITYKWPLPMCATISIVISIVWKEIDEIKAKNSKFT